MSIAAINEFFTNDPEVSPAITGSSMFHEIGSRQEALLEGGGEVKTGTMGIIVKTIFPEEEDDSDPDV